MEYKSVERIGTYLEVDADGFLHGVAKDAQMRPPWDRAVEELVHWYREALGEELHSVYVRGSVAKGLAVEGVSDLDSYAVLGPEAGSGADVSAAWVRELEASFARDFPFVVGVEVDAVPFEAAVAVGGVEAFILKVESVCVHGVDLSDRIERFSLGPHVAFQTRYFRRHLELFLQEYPVEPYSERPAFLAWMLRRFLRLGMELVMVEERRYTRDLYLCYESFAKHFPTEAGPMRRALELAVNPVADGDSERFVRSFGGWLAAEADRKLASWGLERVR